MADAKNPFTTDHVAAPECALCGTTGATVQLHQCRVCRRRFCDECAYKSHKGRFCSEACGRIFFEGAGDEEPDEFDEDRDYDE